MYLTVTRTTICESICKHNRKAKHKFVREKNFYAKKNNDANGHYCAFKSYIMYMKSIM